MAGESIDQLARKLAESLPQSVRAVRDDLEQNFRSILDSGIARLELVTREEFEVQEAVLARTRAKLEALEERLRALEVPAAPASGPAKKRTARKSGAEAAAAGKTARKKTKKASAKKAPTRKKKKKTQAASPSKNSD